MVKKVMKLVSYNRTKLFINLKIKDFFQEIDFIHCKLISKRRYWGRLWPISSNNFHVVMLCSLGIGISAKKSTGYLLKKVGTASDRKL